MFTAYDKCKDKDKRKAKGLDQKADKSYGEAKDAMEKQGKDDCKGQVNSE
jgi:hypothetical protein